MSREHGMAALRLEMTERVPRTEYSLEMHWDVIRAVTGLNVNADSPYEEKAYAQRLFFKIFNYDLAWSTEVDRRYLGKYCTDMGHGVYEAGGRDYRLAKEPVFKDVEEVFSFDPATQLPPIDEKRMVEIFNASYDSQCARYEDAVTMTGTYITCMSGLIDMLGWEMLLLAAGTDGEKFGEFANRYAQWMQPFFNALAECKAPVIMVHDDIVWTSGPFLHPKWYREYVFPNYKKLFAPVIEAGKKLLFTSDGNYTEFIDDIAAAGAHGFVLEPCTDMEYIAKKYGKTHVFVGNADTRVLLHGTKEDIYNEVLRCMRIGKNCPGYFMAVGNHIPPNTPVENVLWYEECYEKLSRR